MSVREVTLSMLRKPVAESEMPTLMAAVEELMLIWGDLYQHFAITDSSGYQVKGVHFTEYEEGIDELFGTNGSAVLYVYKDHEIHVRVGLLGTTFKAFGLNNHGENVVTFLDGRVEIASCKVVYTFDGTLSLRVDGNPVADIDAWIAKEKDDAFCPCCPDKPDGGCFGEKDCFELVAA